MIRTFATFATLGVACLSPAIAQSPISEPISSSDPCLVFGFSGSPNTQTNRLNAGPPAYPGPNWRQPLRLQAPGLWNGNPMVCGSTANGLLSATAPLAANVVSYDGCRSAFYRFTFCLPTGYANARLSLIGNVDDAAIIYLNGVRVTPAFVGTRLTTQPPGVWIWPNPNTLTIRRYFRSGENELVFAVHGGLSTDPSAMQFEGTLQHTPPAPISFGTGCIGTGGIPQITESGPARIGQSLCLTLSGSPSAASAALLVGTFESVYLPSPNCGIHVVQPILARNLQTNAAGTTKTCLQIPPDPTLRGLLLYCQFVVADPRGGLQVGNARFAVSRGLRFRVDC